MTMFRPELESMSAKQIRLGDGNAQLSQPDNNHMYSQSKPSSMTVHVIVSVSVIWLRPKTPGRPRLVSD